MVFLGRFPELGVDVLVVFLVFPEFFFLGCSRWMERFFSVFKESCNLGMFFVKLMLFL